ncbi:DUF2007 domain-containing protein [Pseudoxanthomonas mexicana]|uniref:putative signal transducing protein n=1 Tax=Pseudoxanthomonas mexicana TaxID=128785 RepID=UPI00398B6375
MQIVYRANHLFDAHLVRHALEEAGLPAFVLGESLLGGMGELPVFGMLRVCVPDAAAGQAQDIIAALDLGAAPEDPAWDEDAGEPGILPA